jgi:hypothetical protein
MARKKRCPVRHANAIDKGFRYFTAIVVDDEKASAMVWIWQEKQGYFFFSQTFTLKSEHFLLEIAVHHKSSYELNQSFLTEKDRSGDDHVFKSNASELTG